MSELRLDGRAIPVFEGDTVAAAGHRAGVRTWTRSLKYHRRRGLYCLTGDCPNCLVTVDGEPGQRACMTPARDGQRVEREPGWPSTEHDLLAVTDKMHWAMPVGFYYKAFIRPRFAWELAEKVIRRATGVGTLPLEAGVNPKPSRHVHVGTLVIGAGVAGLAAADEAAEAGDTVLVCDEREIGWSLTTDDDISRVQSLADTLRPKPGVELAERTVAIGIFEGPVAALVGPRELSEVRAERIVVATGAHGSHALFEGNDLPGVWLGRGAALLAARHGVKPFERAVVVGNDQEAEAHANALSRTGVDVIRAAGPVVSANGRRHVTGVTVETSQGRRSFACDAVVVCGTPEPRDTLLRMSADLEVRGAGEVVRPGCSIEEAEASGRAVISGTPDEPAATQAAFDAAAGMVCLCEDVGVHELEVAWDEGWTSSEILKRYTTATMGPCQGALCGRHLADFAASKGAVIGASGRTTARPPVRAPRLEDLVGGVHEQIPKRTALHERHTALGARLDRSGSWLRPGRYGDHLEEYWAVRQRVSVMDVSTLGKLLIGGRDARVLLDRVFPLDVAGVAPPRARYLLALDEGGYVMDDGLLCALEDGRYYLTSTSGGADAMEAWLRNWADRFDLHVHIVSETARLGAINVAGPHARDLLARLSDDDLSRQAIPYPGHAEITVAGIPCRAIAVGFVGELSFELHHPRSRSLELWDALITEGSRWDIRPHGLDALDLLRMEKGHIYLGQDTLPDDHPAKLGLEWTVAMNKEWFVGKASLERMAKLGLERRFVGLEFDSTPQRGAPLSVNGRIVGRVTSCADSPVLGRAVGLGWIRGNGGVFPATLEAGNGFARVAATPLYDPTGARIRA